MQITRRRNAWRAGTLAVVAAMTIGACSSGGESTVGQDVPPQQDATEPTATTAGDVQAEPALAVVLDERTAIFPKGTDLWQDGATPATSATPDDAAFDAALAAIDGAAELAWAAGHTRFVSGRADTDEGPLVVIDFSCSAEPLTAPAQALSEARRAIGTDDGGDCYGFAVFDDRGALLRWGVNGEA